ncbi:unnamed protein product [Symbiodinium microadriaticum]|nr:unnamed protein product [Symbiodinium microadriaticum]CAE7938860.1 unnamed protein product [Symbiodinium sp. KB8]
MVLDLCPERYDGGKEHLLWHPEKEETQRRRWLAPDAPKPVPVKVPKAVRGATTVAPASSEHTRRTMAASFSYVVGQGPGRELSRTHASARGVAGGFKTYTNTIPKPAVKVSNMGFAAFEFSLPVQTASQFGGTETMSMFECLWARCVGLKDMGSYCKDVCVCLKTVGRWQLMVIHFTEQGRLRGDVVVVLFLNTSILFCVVHHLLPVEAARGSDFKHSSGAPGQREPVMLTRWRTSHYA